MKTYSHEMPTAPYEIEYDGDKADILFYKNVKTVEDGYEYDFYRATVQNTVNLSAQVEKNYDAWVEMLEAEELATLNKLYAERVASYIRGKYSVDDELAIQRQRESKPDEFAEYNDFVEKCKEEAHKEIFG